VGTHYVFHKLFLNKGNYLTPEAIKDQVESGELSKESFDLITEAVIKTAEHAEETKYLIVPAAAVTTSYNAGICCLIIIVLVALTVIITYVSVKTYLHLTKEKEEQVQEIQRTNKLKEVSTFYE